MYSVEKLFSSSDEYDSEDDDSLQGNLCLLPSKLYKVIIYMCTYRSFYKECSSDSHDSLWGSLSERRQQITACSEFEDDSLLDSTEPEVEALDPEEIWESSDSESD